MTKETYDKLTDVLAADEIEMDAINSMDELVAQLKDKGIEVTADELKIYFEGVSRLATESDELSDDELEEVSGGGAIINWLKKQVKQIKDAFEYVFGGGYTEDYARGKKIHPWIARLMK